MNQRVYAFLAGLLVGSILGFMTLRSMLPPVERCVFSSEQGFTICTGRATPNPKPTGESIGGQKH